jgi:streptogramin lyase
MSVGLGTDSVLRYNSTTGEFIDTFIPPGSGGLAFPFGLSFGPDGNLYVGNVATQSILRYNGTTGEFIDTFVPPGSGGLFAWVV